ncbi:MAG: insulinase family protein [Kofleriaceae bacterium]
MKAFAVCAVLIGCGVDARFDTLHMTQPAITEPFKVTSWRLANGLRVAVLRDPRARLTSIDLRFDVGTGDDPIGRSGFALLAGEAVGLRSSSAELTSSVAIDLDRTELTATTLDVPAALELAARRLETTCADLTPELTAVARDHALQQLTGVPPAFVRAVWGDGHPYGHDLGTPELARITDAELCEFVEAHYAPSSATLVVTGGVGPEIVGQLEARFGPIAAGAVHAQPPVTPITPTARRERRVIWGLGKPTAALAFVIPALGDQDDYMVELAIRRIQAWADERKLDLHVAVVGGRRGRALVLGIEAARESDLEKAHDKLYDLLQVAYVLDEDSNDLSSDDQLLEAQALDDPLLRGGLIADLVVAGRRLELLRRVHGFAKVRSPRKWIQEHLTAGSARMLDLIPAVANGGQSIEALAEPGIAVDHALAGAVSPAEHGAAPAPEPAADPAPLRPLDRPFEDYTLANGLRVLLAADPGATTIDVRLVFPVGSNDEPAAGVAIHAASDLQVDDGYNAGPDAHERVAWYASTAIEHNDVEVTDTSTHFRSVGFAALGDWHVFSIGWHVIKGTYEAAALAPFRRHYIAKGATLIVSGGFDRAVLKPIIDRWFGTWPTPKQPPPRAVPKTSPRPLTYEPAELQSVQLELGYTSAKPVNTGAATLLASAIQLRLAAATRTGAQIAVSFDLRDSRLLVTAEMDPKEAPAIAHVIAGELAQIRATGVSASESVHARQRALSRTLAAEIGVSGRARQLEDAVIMKRSPNDDSMVTQLRAMTAADVTEAARLLIDPATVRVMVRSPKGGSSAVLGALGLNPATAERR